MSYLMMFILYNAAVVQRLLPSCLQVTKNSYE